MPATGSSMPTRSRRSAALRCGACGAHEPLRAPARAQGWQRCRHCRTPIVVPWSDAEAFDGPNARTMVLVRPGRVHFMVPRRSLLGSGELAAWLLIGNVLTAFGIGLLEVGPETMTGWHHAGRLGLLAVGVTAMAAAVRRWRSVQHLLVGRRRAIAYHSVGRRRSRRAECPLAGSVDLSIEESDDGIGGHRFRLRIHAGGGEPLELRLPTRLEAQWVAALVRAAWSQDEAPKRRRCPACAAPIEIGVEERSAGEAHCAFCRAGFVVDVRELELAPVALPDFALPPVAGAGPVDERRDRAGERAVLRWRLPRPALVQRAVAALGLSLPALFFAGFAGVAGWILPETPSGAWGLRAYVVLGGLGMGLIGAFAAGLAALALWGREEIGMDDGTLWRRSLLGPFDLSRLGWLPPPPSAPGAAAGRSWRGASGSIPIARLVRVSFERELGETRVLLEAPHRALELAWELPAEMDWRLRQRLVEELAARLSLAGRDVLRADGRSA